jgi:DNA-binding FadR family transcriptional regulator
MAELELQPARRERLADVLYGQILEQLTSGTLQEGDRLPPESEISRNFGVSRPVVRQALQHLRADGLIVARRGAGTYVQMRPSTGKKAAPPPADIARFLRSFEVRIAVEGEAARLAATRHSQAHLTRLKAAMSALEKSFENGVRGEDEDFAFHLALAEASDNPLFSLVLNDLHKTVLGSMTTALNVARLGAAARRQHVLAEHHRIIEAVAAREPENAALYVRYHLTQARARVANAQC